ncbi:TsoY family (seleno)protein [Corynebacterium sp. H78]|uniref:TsoY family (seleno)protein n=1 Tax=Corynebacterium sp. H78 TaxID=3133417 RepID=UPI0030AEC9A0
MIRNLGEKYSPLYFLAALGFGGMSVFFFMLFMHVTPHPDTPMPTFESIWSAYNDGNAFLKASVWVGYVGMTIFLFMHFFLLIWNLREFFAFRKTSAYTQLRSSNAEVTLMAVPLTLGMSVNGIFVAMMAYVPGLWDIIQSFMPFALIMYGAVGALAIYYMTVYLKRVINAGFDFKANGGLNQLLAVFAMSMIAVGFAAPAAMGTNKWVVMIAIFGSLFFAAITVLLFLAFMPIGAASMMRYGLSLQNSATLWLTVPVTTLLGITFLRLRHGMNTLADLGPKGPVEHPKTTIFVLVVLAAAVMVQLTFLGLGHMVMRENGFYKQFVLSNETASPAAFTLICPGVALSVLSMFLLHVGIVQNNLIEKFSAPYYIAITLIATVAAITIWAMVTLFRNQLSRNSKIGSEQRA